MYISKAIDPLLVQVRQVQDGIALFFFNTGDTSIQRTYSFKSLGLKGPFYISNWLTSESSDEEEENVSIELIAHDSTLLFLSQHPNPLIPKILG
jgi:hypothetical protein